MNRPYEQVAAELGDSLRVVKIDHDQSPATLKKYGISGIPVLLLFTGGELVARLIGSLDADDLMSQLRPLLAVRATSDGAGSEDSAVGPRDEDGDQTPAGWIPRGPRTLTFSDDSTAQIGILNASVPDKEKSQFIPTQGTLEIAEGHVTLLFVQESVNDQETETPAEPTDLSFLRELAADGLERMIVQAPSLTAAALTEIGHLTGLIRLSISTKELIGSTTDVAAALAGLTSIDELRLTIPQADDAIVTAAAGLPNLSTLYVRADDVTDAGLVQLAPAQGLKSLQVCTHEATDAGLAELANADLPNLRSLGICVPETTDAGITERRP